MQIMIGCAKDMRSTCPTELPLRSEPLFADRAAANVMQLMGYTEEELCGVLGCNAQIARENRLRYIRFADGDGGLQAVMAYSGIVFKYLDAGSFCPADCDFAQRHLWITSFLYGLLRPMDVIKPYRLEGGVVLPANGVSMFDYWKPLLTDVLIDSVKADDGVLVDLASSEMRRLFDWRRVARELTVVRPEFFVQREGRLKTVVVYAKMCRGAMTRYALCNRLDGAEGLRGFDFEGFGWLESESTPGSPVFALA